LRQLDLDIEELETDIELAKLGFTKGQKVEVKLELRDIPHIGTLNNIKRVGNSYHVSITMPSGWVGYFALKDLMGLKTIDNE
jgi:hypothetical protein